MGGGEAFLPVVEGREGLDLAGDVGVVALGDVQLEPGEDDLVDEELFKGGCLSIAQVIFEGLPALFEGLFDPVAAVELVDDVEGGCVGEVGGDLPEIRVFGQ